MTSSLRSSLLVGQVMHQRLSPQPHSFRYRLYMHQLSLDELPELSRRFVLLGVNRWRPSAFFESDHLPGEGPLRQRVETMLRAHGVDRRAALTAVIAEVNNTFGESHAYVLDPGEPLTAKKVFHVSPFLTLDGTYRFVFDVSPSHLDVRIDLHRGGAPVLVSRLSLERRPLSEWGLALALLRYPFVTLALVGRIHWQAFRLWWKGATYYPKPPLDPEAARTGSSE